MKRQALKVLKLAQLPQAIIVDELALMRVDKLKLIQHAFKQGLTVSETSQLVFVSEPTILRYLQYLYENLELCYW